MFSIFCYCMSFCIKLWSIYSPYESGRISYYFIQCFQYFAIAWMCGGSSHDYVYHNALAYEHMLLLFPRENLLSSASGGVFLTLLLLMFLPPASLDAGSLNSGPYNCCLVDEKGTSRAVGRNNDPNTCRKDTFNRSLSVGLHLSSTQLL